MDVAEFHKYLETTFREWRDEERIAALFAKIIPERNNTLKLQWWANVLAGAEAKGLVVFNAATLASLFHHPSSLSPKCIPEVLDYLREQGTVVTKEDLEENTPTGTTTTATPSTSSTSSTAAASALLSPARLVGRVWNGVSNWWSPVKIGTSSNSSTSTSNRSLSSPSRSPLSSLPLSVAGDNEVAAVFIATTWLQQLSRQVLALARQGEAGDSASSSSLSSGGIAELGGLESRVVLVEEVYANPLVKQYLTRQLAVIESTCQLAQAVTSLARDNNSNKAVLRGITERTLLEWAIKSLIKSSKCMPIYSPKRSSRQQQQHIIAVFLTESEESDRETLPTASVLRAIASMKQARSVVQAQETRTQVAIDQLNSTIRSILSANIAPSPSTSSSTLLSNRQRATRLLAQRKQLESKLVRLEVTHHNLSQLLDSLDESSSQQLIVGAFRVGLDALRVSNTAVKEAAGTDDVDSLFSELEDAILDQRSLDDEITERNNELLDITSPATDEELEEEYQQLLLLSPSTTPSKTTVTTTSVSDIGVSVADGKTTSALSTKLTIRNTATHQQPQQQRNEDELLAELEALSISINPPTSSSKASSYQSM